MAQRMNAEKLKKMQEGVRTGGKGSVRRKKKVVRASGATDSKKIKDVLKRANVNAMPGCDEAVLYKDDGKEIRFTNPKISANFNANTWLIEGKGEERTSSGFGSEDVASFGQE